MSRTTVHTSDAPAAIGPYSQAIKAGTYVFTSSQLAIDPKTGGSPVTSPSRPTRFSPI